MSDLQRIGIQLRGFLVSPSESLCVPSKVVARNSGFTLIEMIISIVLVGILGAVMAGFLRIPLQSYEDVARRSALSAQADIALRRLTREVRDALPNSVRSTTDASGQIQYLEFLPLRTGGRYRNQPSGAAVLCPAPPGGGLGAPFSDALETGVVDNCFRSLGAVPNLAQVVANDWLVINNLGPGFAGANAWFGGNAVVAAGNKTRVTSALTTLTPGEDRINFQAFAFPADSPDFRFHITSGPVTYVCAPDPVGGNGTLRRHWGYNIAAVQPTPAPPASPPGGQSALLAEGISACAITYAPNIVAQRNGLVSINIAISRADFGGARETVTLLQQIHVSNTP